MNMSEDAARLALRAMRAVAEADGESADETELIDAAARLLGIGGRLDALAPDELHSVHLDDDDRTRVVQAAILVALVDQTVDPTEVEAVRAIADALGVDEPRVRNLEQVERGRLKVLWLDLARRSWAKDVFVDALRHEGPAGVWKIVGPLLGRANDPALAQRYIALGELSEDTFGHAYFRFIVDHDLGFPGEPWGVPESGIWHDCAHVLGEFSTEPADEIQVVSFIAGFSRSDPFFWLFTITLQFHLGIDVSPYSAPERGLFDPEAILAAFARGAAMTEDLSAPGWDPWRWFDKPLARARRELNVTPRE